MLRAVRQRELDEASRWADRLVHLDESEGPLGFFERVTFIQSLGVLGQERRARGADRAPLPNSRDRVAGPRVEGLVDLRPDRTGADGIRLTTRLSSFVAEALRAGEPEGWIRSFVDIGPRLSPLLRSAVSQGILSRLRGQVARRRRG